MISFFNLKGGVGRTQLATNAAVAFGLLGQRAVLVDFDFLSGNTDMVLGQAPEKTVGELLQDKDWGAVGNYLTSCGAPVELLAPPGTPLPSFDMGTDGVHETLAALRQEFGFVLVDLPANLSPHVLATLDGSDLLLVVTTGDSLSIKSTAVALEHLAIQGQDLGAARLVVNQYDTDGLTEKQIEQAVGLPVFWRIDRDRAVSAALNRGVPFVINKPRSSAARSVTKLAQALLAEFGAAWEAA